MLFGKGGHTARYNGPRSGEEMTGMLSGGGCEKCNKEGCNCGPDCGCGEGECDCGESLGGGGQQLPAGPPGTTRADLGEQGSGLTGSHVFLQEAGTHLSFVGL
jgi:hypothetical protein